jgi:cyclophilin family peptidyl-prolyl cis-trans isomerase
MLSSPEGGNQGGIRSERGVSGRLLLVVIVCVVAVVAVGAWLLSKGGNEDIATLPPPTLPSPQGPCDFTDPVVIPAKQLQDAPPPMRIDPERHRYSAELNTACGPIRIKLLAKDAPVTVNNFITLSKQHWYNGLLFHRLSGSLDIIQTGDPTCMTDEVACGSGTPGYHIDDELTGKEKYVPGTVAMANTGPDKNGAQFFIVTGPGAKSLPPKYTIFGQVADEESLQVAQTIQSLPVEARPDAPPGAEPESPKDRIWLRGVKISEEKI